jgi:hypothetical protein
LLPAHLDAALRVDVGRLGSELGTALASDVMIDLLVDRDHEPSATWLAEALQQTEVSWLGLRVHGDLRAAAKVLVSRGAFAGWQRRAPAGFGWIEPGDGSAPHFFRTPPSPGAFERIYPLDARLLVLVSAEMSPPRAAPASNGTAGGAATAEQALRPPERGTVSVSARAGKLVDMWSTAFPNLAERFSGAEAISGYAEPRATDVDVELEITFAAAEQAQAGSEILEALLERLGQQQCALGQAARAARVSSFGRSARLRAELDDPVVRALKTCAFAGECCGAARAD